MAEAQDQALIMRLKGLIITALTARKIVAGQLKSSKPIIGAILA
jgi:hypothetical protein